MYHIGISVLVFFFRMVTSASVEIGSDRTPKSQKLNAIRLVLVTRMRNAEDSGAYPYSIQVRF